MKKINKLFLGVASVATVAAPVAAVVSCGPVSTTAKYVEYTGTTGAALKASTYFVTDGGKIDDKTFNQSVWEGTVVSAELKGTEADGLTSNRTIKPSSSAEIGTAYSDAKTKGAKLIVAAGFNHGTAMTAFSQKNPNIGFVLVDSGIDAINAAGKTVQQGNVASILFKTGQASFLEGYAAAKHVATDTSITIKKVGVYGGMDIPSVTSYINGFKAGVAFWNSENATKVEVLDGGFAKNFATGGTSATIATKLVTDGAQLILSVGGPQYLDVAAAIKAAKSNAKLIGVDVDVAKADGSVANYVFDSILKNLTTATSNVLNIIYGTDATAAKAEFGKVHMGDLASKEVGIVNPSLIGDAAAITKVTTAAEKLDY